MNVKLIGTFVAGMGVGGGLTYVALKKHIQKGNEARIAEAVDEVLASAKSKEPKEEVEEPEPDTDYIQFVHDQLDTIGKATEEYKSDSKDPDDISVPDFNDPVADPEEGPAEEAHEEMDIYAIGIADFMQDAKYDKKYAVYYRGDNMLIEEATDKTLDIQEVLGDLADLIQMAYTDLEVLYIRNERTSTDYQIDFDPGSYGGGDD